MLQACLNRSVPLQLVVGYVMIMLLEDTAGSTSLAVPDNHNKSHHVSLLQSTVVTFRDSFVLRAGYADVGEWKHS